MLKVQTRPDTSVSAAPTAKLSTRSHARLWMRLMLRVSTNQRRYSISVIAVALIMTILFVGFATMRATYKHAAAEGVLSDAAGYAYSIQANTDESTQQLAADSNLVSISESAATALANERAETVALRTSSQANVQPGLLIDGRYPRDSGQAAISQRLRQQLRVQIGDLVTVRDTDGVPTDLVVSGVVSNPAQRDQLLVAAVGPASDTGTLTFLARHSPLDDPELRRMAEARTISLRTVSILGADTAEEAWYQVVPGWNHPDRWFVVLATSTLLIVLLTMAGPAAAGVRGLAAAGMRTRTAWYVMATTALATAGAGVVGGAVFGVVAVLAAHDLIAQSLNQQWYGISVPWSAAASYLVQVLASTAVLIFAVVQAHLRAWRLPRVPGALLVTVFVIGATLFVLTSAFLLPVTLALPLALVVSLTLGAVLKGFLFRSRNRIRQQVLNHLSAPWVVLTALACAVATFGVYQSAWIAHGVLFSESASPKAQPDGSFMASTVPQEALADLGKQYRAAGGREMRAFTSLVESSSVARVTSPSVTDCMRELNESDPFALPPQCAPQDTRSPINTIALQDNRLVRVDDKQGTAVGGTAYAEPALIVNGHVSVVVFDVSTGRVVRQVSIPAEPRSDLGGNVPGLVLPADATTVQDLSLRPASTDVVVLEDFDRLSSDNQALVRGLLTRLAPTSLFAESDGRQSRAETRTAWGYAAFSGLVIVAMLATAGSGLVAAQRGERRVLVAAGARKGDLQRLYLRLLLVPALMLTLSTGLGRWAAWVAGIHEGSGFGVAWLLPWVSGLLALAVVFIAYRRYAATELASAER